MTDWHSNETGVSPQHDFPMRDESLAAINKWFDTQEQRAGLDEIISRTTLQAGIHDDVILDYAPGRTSISSEVKSDADGLSPGSRKGALSVAQIQESIVPVLAHAIAQRVEKLADTALIDYRFCFRAIFPATEGRLLVTLFTFTNEVKKQRLLESIHAYTDRYLTHGDAPTEPLQTFFLARHLLDVQLFPSQDIHWIMTQFEQIQRRNAGHAELSEHRRNIIGALKTWVEQQFLLRYCDVSQPEHFFEPEIYTLKPGITLEQQDPQTLHLVELVLYAAVMILRYEPSYSKSRALEYLDIAKQLGYPRALSIMEEGSGAFEKAQINLKNESVECVANDVFSTITVRIRQESAEAYEQALRFITRLLTLGFPKSYKIVLKSSMRQYLPIKGLAKSDTHRFFANALQYESNYPFLEDYARTAIEEFEWYADSEGEKCCMPGSYAVFGLGLTEAGYFPLVKDYMESVDDEHQSVQDAFIRAFFDKHSVTAQNVATLVACLSHATESLKLNMLLALENDALFEQLVEEVRMREPAVIEHILYLIWGNTKKLAALVKKSEAKRGALLTSLIQASA
ncbi:DUF6138 family protein [Pectobacterium brasiliense]|uniref:Uncharacterized protein n=1 Tax=Pectobacterium brasiliense TaxID=180957 RepID=A0A433NCW5_9GAMM|nr:MULTISPECIES: DUF6138 family protein [Pectobacterium]GKW29038.1 hypothetical protein PEC331060_22160 [Pectobacterium carotovorum subsp. carotovorum]MBN3047308.1 hypothetical protein [Pectobacterium brasiliense]MBN3075794.1 hypothetical protein [Pectobacterium brasiliense]MBN3086007.1 hypothetical protein [Pectobacterium brasiliense]MBN3090357.1 hypothetical protein [Pectobacterium brasiliense]